MSQRNEIDDIFAGILLVFGMHLAALAIVGVISGLLFRLHLAPAAISLLTGLTIIGISQLIYVIPVIFWARNQQEWGLMKGVIIGAVITALLNGGCWILVWSN